ncbi:MAG: twin-arginine translocase subunit TatC [Candidatus Thermoplasmatota archaeon]|nr:twin-arginine translocase subunit TatC [Candidatus Thermoplasmatota archaeon]
MTGGLSRDVARQADIIPRAEMRSLVEHLKGRARSFSALFIVALIIGYPFADRMISWAANNTGWRPEGVDIVIIQPLELILLKLRISVHVALGATMLALIFDLAWNGREIIARGKRTMVKEGSFVRLAGVCLASVALAMLGLFYANSILIPFLLEYLAADSTSSGLDATWRIGSWLGFIVGLLTASAIGFQVPLIAFVLIRSGLILPETITGNRTILWFSALAIGAFLSPPDPLSMFLVGGPVVVLLEIAIIFERITNASDRVL